MRVRVLNTHRWLFQQLGADTGVDRDDADAIVWLEPPWPDREAPERLRHAELARVFVFSQADAPVRWAPGLYASLPRRLAGAGIAGGFYVLPHHRHDGGLSDRLESARMRGIELLWSFVGTRSNAPVRDALFALDDDRSLVRDTQRFQDVVRWNWETTHRDEAAQSFDGYADDLGRSAFVVCPRGQGASSIRIFEAMQAGRCPVIVSDDWLEPPFVDWSSCSLRVAEREVSQLPRILRAHESRAGELGATARAEWERRFAPERQLETIVAAVQHVGPAARARLLATAPFATPRPIARRIAARASRRRR